MSSNLNIKNSFSNNNVNKFKNSINTSNTIKSKNNSNLEIKSFLDLYDQNINEYFDRLDNYNGFFTTQQIESVNFDNFEEHIFFDSAIEKTNYSFKKIFNDYPYDGSEQDLLNYLNELDGYTRFILKNKHSKNKGYLRFDGNHYISIKDRNGWLLNDYNKQIKTGNLNLVDNFSFSFDFWIYPLNIDANPTDNEQIIVQKVDENNNGYTIYLDSFDINSCNINFLISKGSEYQKCVTSIDLDKWSHVNLTFNSLEINREKTIKGKYFINSVPSLGATTISGSGINLLFDNDFNNIDLTIGKGKNHTLDGSNILSDENKSFNFIGLLDELRVFAGKTRDREVIAKEKDENITSINSLKLYLKFNEPSTSYVNNNIVLDHSGNRLHGVIKDNNNNLASQANTSLLREKYNSIKVPLKYEMLEDNPVLFSNYLPSLTIQNKILESAKQYDLANPNSFWKLFPKNIFIEGSDFDDVSQTYINENSATSNENLFGVKSPTNHKMINLLSMWARFFDQIKMYIDSITKLIDVNYDNLNNNKKIDGVLLPLALKLSGYNFREILPYPILEKLKNKNLTHEEIISDVSIRQIQNNLWQRFLINSKDVLMSKGTKSGINSIFNSFGLEASKFISIKEFNGQNKFNIDNNFYSKKSNFKEIDFSCGTELFNESATNNRLYFKTPSYSNTNTDNLLHIDKEWSVECLYSYDSEKTGAYSLEQSLLRLDNVAVNNAYVRPHINIVFNRSNKKNKTGDLYIYVNDNNDSVKISSIKNVDLLNGEIHHVCLRRKENKNSNQDLSYFEYILTINSTSNNFFSKELKSTSIQTKTNIAGKQSLDNRFTIGYYGNYEESDADDYLDSLSYSTNFSGKIANFRVYSKSFSEQELLLKCKAFTTVSLDNGTDSSILNIDLFENLNNISFDNNTNQFTIQSLIDLNHSKLSDFNKAYLSLGSNITDYMPFKSRKIHSLNQNYEVDFPRSNNFIHINSFESENFKKQYSNNNFENMPRVSPDYLYSKDKRLSIDFSMINFLNQDILKIININKLFSEKLSQSANLYEDSYTDLNNLRDKYFERLEREIDVSEIYQMYKYFDNILEEILYSCIPSKVKYKGFNFVYESHALERNKYQYKMINSNIPVFDENTKYQYHKDFTNNKNYRKTEGFGFSAITKNRIT